MLQIVAETTGVSLAQADEVRRTMGTPQGQEDIEAWWRPAAKARGYTATERDEIWAVLKAFASFGFCKAHAAAFALPTYQSAWLKTHYPAHFLAGVLTHDPGMYPKRLILDDARNLGITVLGLDVNASKDTFVVERLEEHEVDPHWTHAHRDLPDARRHAIRLALTEVKGISESEVAAIVAGQPFADLADFWARTGISRPVLERIVLAGGFDAMYGLGGRGAGLGRHGLLTRRDLLLHIAELDRWQRSFARTPGRARRATAPPLHAVTTAQGAGAAGERPRGIPGQRGAGASRGSEPGRGPRGGGDRAGHALLDLGDRPEVRQEQWPARVERHRTGPCRLDHPQPRRLHPCHGRLRPLLDALGVLVPAT